MALPVRVPALFSGATATPMYRVIATLLASVPVLTDVWDPTLVDIAVRLAAELGAELD